MFKAQASPELREKAVEQRQTGQKEEEEQAPAGTVSELEDLSTSESDSATQGHVQNDQRRLF